MVGNINANNFKDKVDGMGEVNRKETRIEGCLLQSGILFPQKDVKLCGVCRNRSDDVGNLAEYCHVEPTE